jgi:hypothetical protein
MKPKHMSVLATVLVASLGVNVAHAIQKHDPIFRTTCVYSGVRDPDVVQLVGYQSGSPRWKKDLYVAHSSNTGMDRDLVQEMSSQSGSPHAKSDRRFMLAPLK